MNAPHERDRSIERLLQQSFKTVHQDVTDSCLDAETLAAWVDGGLAASAAETAQTHVADCARCQAMAATLVRASAIASMPEPSPRRWFGWLVPLTAAAAAVAVWVAVPRTPGAPSPVATDTQQQAAAKVEEPASLDKLSQPAAAEKDESVASREANETKEDFRRDSGRQEANRLEPQQKGNAPPAALAAPQGAPSRAADVLAESVAAGGVEIVSSDPAVRWRLTGSVVERSTNRGSSWNAIPTPVAAELLAGVAPSATVCWIVGRGGLVLLTTDGATFSRLAFPEMTDVSAVRATDARSASVTTADGRTFSTADGGATWTRP